MAVNGTTNLALHDPYTFLRQIDYKHVCKKTIEVAKTIFKAVVCIALYWTNPTLFAVGFIIGVAEAKHMRKVIDRITTVWHENTGLMSFGLGFGAFLSLPITLAAGSFLVGAHIGAHLSEVAQKRREENSTKASGDAV